MRLFLTENGPFILEGVKKIPVDEIEGMFEQAGTDAYKLPQYVYRPTQAAIRTAGEVIHRMGEMLAGLPTAFERAGYRLSFAVQTPDTYALTYWDISRLDHGWSIARTDPVKDEGGDPVVSGESVARRRHDYAFVRKEDVLEFMAGELAGT